MKNVHIELVKQWLADPTTVSPEELKINAEAANAAAMAVEADFSADFAASYLVNHAVTVAAIAAAAGATDAATDWVKRYEELTK